MADEKVVELTALTAPVGADITYVVDISDTTDSPEGTSKKMRLDAYTNPAGIARYDAVADLPVTGVVTTSYKVTADPTPALNGFYTWTGSVYTQDSSLFGGAVADGDTEGVDGNTVYDVFADLDSGFEAGVTNQIKNIFLIGADINEEYAISNLRRDLGGKNFIDISIVGGALVCSLTIDPNVGVTTSHLVPEYSGSGISAIVVVEWANVPATGANVADATLAINRAKYRDTLNYDDIATYLSGSGGVLSSYLDAQGLEVFDEPADRTVANVYAPVPFIKDISIVGADSTKNYWFSSLKYFSASGKTGIDISDSTGIVSTFFVAITANTYQTVTVPSYAPSGVETSAVINIDTTGMADDVQYASTTLFVKKNRYNSVLDVSSGRFIQIPNQADFDGTLALNDGLESLTSGSSLGGSNSGSKNMYVGIGAGNANTVAMKNVGVGYNVLNATTSGWANTGVGSEALSTGIGTGVLTISGTGVEFYANTAIGEGCMKLTTTGSYNTAIGVNSLLNNTTGQNNTAVGVHALDGNLTGIQNIAIGRNALRNAATGDNNIGVGFGAFMEGTGSQNIGVGQEVLQDLTTGSNNIAVGRLAGSSLTTGSSNIIIGYNIDASAVGVSNELNIGGLITGSMVSEKYVAIDGFQKLLPLASAPTSPTGGMVYSDTDGNIYHYNSVAVAWQQLN